MRVIVVSVVMLVVAQSLAAQQHIITTLSGATSDQQSFQAQISRCRTVVGEPFSALVANLILRKVPLHLSRSAQSSAYLFGVAGKPHEVNLDHILVLPEETRDGSAVTYPSDVPNWATTQCVALTHELAEAYYAHVRSSGFEPSHRYAIGKENQVRRALGQSQCREIETAGNEQKFVPHTDHDDFFLRIGHHTERYHRKGSPVIVTVTYEAGSDLPCRESNYDASLP